MQLTQRAANIHLVIFDVDGVLVASPHERAWREALAGFADPAAFSLRVQDSPLPGFSLSGESVSIVTELRE